MRIPTGIFPSVRPSSLAPARVESDFRDLLAAGARMVVAGSARRRPRGLLSAGYVPSRRVDLFGTRFYLCDVRQNADIRFFVAYVVQGGEACAARVYPRIFYKDLSLVWRSASHYVRSEHENWVGKGDVKTVIEDGEELVVSHEASTDLPLEVQTALERASRRTERIAHDERAIGLVLRRGPDDRIAAYRDFTAPRRRAQADRRNLVNGGRPIARFARAGDPSSLRFARGFEPDFARGVVEVARSTSRMYGGVLRRYRIASRNRKVQFLFVAGPRQVWVPACQATTTELSSYGVRTVDALVPDDLLIPGFEYHDTESGRAAGVLESQIPEGFAGAPSEIDPTRADASPWLDRLPVVREFRRRLLSSPPRSRRRRRR